MSRKRIGRREFVGRTAAAGVAVLARGVAPPEPGKRRPGRGGAERKRAEGEAKARPAPAGATT